ncbi:MAG: 50S ribosomal protein L10 [Phycisphaerales bacterium]
MSRQVKEMILDEYKSRFEGVDDAVLVDIRALGANENNEFRDGLRQKQIKVTVVRNRLARMAFEDSKLSGLDTLLAGPSAVVYPTAEDGTVVDVAREIVDWAKKIKTLELKGAVLDGEVFSGKDGVERLSKYPTREEAQAEVVQIVLSPGAQLVGAITGPGGAIASLLKTIEEKLEKGESIAKVG